MKTAFVPDWESHLILKAQMGHSVAFELLADQHRDAMRSLALRMLRDSEDADDAVQEALVKAFRAIRSFQPGKPVLPWLHRICSNCCVDTIRRRRQQVTEAIEKYEFALTDGDRTVADRAESEFDGEIVRAAIEGLPAHYRDILKMRHFRHMEVGEIAVELNKPEGTIKSWLFRARALLKKQLTVSLGAGA